MVQSQDIQFLAARRWEYLIVELQRELEKFYLYYYDNYDDDADEYPIYNGKQNEFHSSFWIQRRLMFEVKVAEEKSIHYCIHPYSHNDAQEVLMMNTRRILTLARIYHLEINDIKITISNLLQLVDLLTELIL